MARWVATSVAAVSALPDRRRSSLAALGDSIANNGGASMAVVYLAQAALAGATSIIVTAPEGANPATQMGSDFLPSILAQVGAETVILGAVGTYTGNGPYTVPLANPLASFHGAGTRVLTKPMTMANNSPQPAWWACLASAGRLRFAGTYGRGGYTASQLRRLYLPLVLQARPGFCYVMAGRNGEESVTATINEVIGLWDALLDNGITPVGSTIPPADSDTGKLSTDRINSALRAAAAQRGIPFADAFAPNVDPATGGWLAGYSTDGTHPSVIRRRAQGLDLWTAVSPFVTASVDYRPKTNAQPDTEVHPSVSTQTNAKMLTGGGTNTSGGSSSSVLPAGWQCSITDATGVISNPTAPSGGGKSIKLERASGATLSVDLFQSSGWRATLNPGRIYRVVIALKTDGMAASYAVDSSTRLTVSVTNAGAGGTTTFGVFGPISLDLDGVLVWDFICTAQQPTSAFVRVLSQAGAQSLAHTIEFWDVDVLDLTALGEDTDFPVIYAA